MAMLIPAARAWGFAIVAVCFAIAALESGLLLNADAAVPGWDKPIHALCAFGVVLMLTPQRERRRLGLVAAIAAGIGWEVAQFLVEPFQGHAPAIYAIDTITDLLADAVGAVLATRFGTPSIIPEPARNADPRGAERKP
jgi:hypothetical protein